jgi:hypothetical protein
MRGTLGRWDRDSINRVLTYKDQTGIFRIVEETDVSSLKTVCRLSRPLYFDTVQLDNVMSE